MPLLELDQTRRIEVLGDGDAAGYGSEGPATRIGVRSLLASRPVRWQVYVPPDTTCNKITYACGQDSARMKSWNSSGPPAPPPSLAQLAFERQKSAAGGIDLEYLTELISNDVVQRMGFFVGAVLACFLSCWCYRTYRFRNKYRYRVPHETFGGI